MLRTTPNTAAGCMPQPWCDTCSARVSCSTWQRQHNLHQPGQRPHLASWCRGRPSPRPSSWAHPSCRLQEGPAGSPGLLLHDKGPAQARAAGVSTHSSCRQKHLTFVLTRASRCWGYVCANAPLCWVAVSLLTSPAQQQLVQAASAVPAACLQGQPTLPIGVATPASAASACM